jgi:hypothetical protein
MNKVLLFTATFVASSMAQAAPNITLVDGTASDGTRLTISGSGFGQGADSVEFTGRNGGVEDSASPSDASHTIGSWSIGGGNGVRGNVYVKSEDSNARTANGRYFTGQVHGNIAPHNAALAYQFPNSVPENTWVYFSYWTKMESAASIGQWKHWRLSNTNTIVDGSGQLVFFNWHNGKSLTFHTGSWPSAYAQGESGHPFWPQHGDGQWTRNDVAVLTSSDSASDGRVTIERFEPVPDKVNLGDTQYSLDGRSPRDFASTFTLYNGEDIYSGVRTYSNSSERFNYLIFQNYIGNNDYNSVYSQVYIDDIYIQVGTRSRVEICDKPSWGECTVREVQYPNSWSNETINIEFNGGLFDSGTEVYLYVVTDNGSSLQVSSPYSLTIDSIGLSPPTAPDLTGQSGS